MLHRRAFLTVGASALGTIAVLRGARAQFGAVTRRSIAGMAANDPDLLALSQAVATMKALPPSDPRNWNTFADIHGNFCPHGNWYFLPWHRAYTVAFEEICRQLSGKTDFALPYWDWTAERRLPAAFIAGNPKSNPLNHSRGRFAAQALPDDMVGQGVIARILSSPDFEAFGSTRPHGQNSAATQWQRRPGTRTELEFNPHDGVHVAIGGDMASAATAARDPIFYLHHANVDRLWSTWNRRGNDNSPERAWRNLRFRNNFIRPDGSPWDVAVAELESTEPLGYRYEAETVGALPTAAASAFAADPVTLDPANRREDTRAARVSRIVKENDAFEAQLRAYRRIDRIAAPRAGAAVRRITLESGIGIHIATANNRNVTTRERPMAVQVRLGRPLSELLEPADLLPDAAGARPRRCIWAVLHDVEPPRDHNTRLRLFLNCAEFSAGTPITNPHYATGINFFAAEHAHGHGRTHGHHAHDGPHARHVIRLDGGERPSIAIDLAPTLARIPQAETFQRDRLTLQFQPFYPGGSTSGSTIRVPRVEIVII